MARNRSMRKMRNRSRARRTNKKSRNVRRTRRNKLRTKRGGVLRMFQSSLLREYKSKLESSSLNELLRNFKASGEPNLDRATIDDINTVYNPTSNVGELNSFLRRLSNEQVEELLKDIKQTKEGKAFYRYILLKFLANNGSAEAQNILAGMFTMSEGVPRNDTEAHRLYALAGAYGNADVQAEWSKYTSDFDL